MPVIVPSLSVFEGTVAGSEVLEEFPIGVSWSLVTGMLARKCLPMSSSAGDKLHHGKGVDL